MTWLQRHRIRHYLRNSIWILPSLGAVAAMVMVRLLHWFELARGWESDLDPGAAQVVLGAMASSMFTFIIFLSSALLIAVQLASAQLTPRIITFIFRNPVMKFSLTVFVFTFSFSLAVLVRIKTSVPALIAYVAAYGFLASLVVFLYLIDHLGKALRPSGALNYVGKQGREVIESVYPRPFTDSREAPQELVNALGKKPTRTIASPGDGVILAVDIQGLETLAQRADCIIELVPQVGDFVGAGASLFRLYHDGATLPAEELCRAVALGQERTMEQDPTFAFRIIVDIASKGLSPAINDPTTAVLAIDQIHYLLRNVGSRDLDEGVVRDSAGQVRVVYMTPDWEDFVHLAIAEIRQYGATSIQIVRRLRAMLEDLLQTLPDERTVLIRQELNALRKTAEHSFPEPEDRVLADVSDFQGVGGRYRHSESHMG